MLVQHGRGMFDLVQNQLVFGESTPCRRAATSDHHQIMKGTITQWLLFSIQIQVYTLIIPETHKNEYYHTFSYGSFNYLCFLGFVV